MLLLRFAAALATDAPAAQARPLVFTAGGDLHSGKPDGRRIAFTSGRDGGESEVHFMRADGSRPRRLTRPSRAVMGLPSSSSSRAARILTRTLTAPRAITVAAGAEPDW